MYISRFIDIDYVFIEKLILKDIIKIIKYNYTYINYVPLERLDININILAAYTHSTSEYFLFEDIKIKY